MKKKISVSSVILLLLLAAAYFILPRVLKGYWLMIANLVLIYSITVYGISLMLGMGGQLSFASISFMGGGAYVIGNFCSGRLGFVMPTPLALLLVIVVFALLGLLFGLVLFRLKGTYFTFATIAVVQVAYTFFLNYKPLFGGAEGITGIEALSLFGVEFNTYGKWFYLLGAFSLLAALLVERIKYTKLGRSLASIRDNEIAAQTLGVNIYMTKVIAFAIASALSAFAGALYCFHGRFVAPEMYAFSDATQFIIMGMLGGINSTFGALFGTAIVVVLPEVLRTFKEYLQFFWGISIILLMVFMPEGFIGLYHRLIKLLKTFLRNRKTRKEKK